MSTSYQMLESWFLLAEANWRSLAFHDNAIPHSALLLGIGRKWSAQLQTMAFVQSLHRSHVENCCNEINDRRFGIELQ